MSKTKLEVGDKIAKEHFSQYSYFGEITRVTEKMAFVKVTDAYTQRFKIEISNGRLTQYPRPAGYYSHSYLLMTPEIKEKIKEQNQIHYTDILMRGIPAKNISPEDRETIINILSKYKK